MPAFKLTLVAALVGLAAPAGTTHTQQVAAATAQAPLDVQQLATVHVALLRAQDSLNAEMAHPRNKTAEGQARLQEALRTRVAAVLASAGLSAEEYQSRRFRVSSDDNLRGAFDKATATLLGAPLPGTTVAAAPAAPAAAAQPEMPAGPVGTHLGHVLVSFMNTPDKAGLLAVAQAEAGIAAQHASLAARTPDNLAAMKTHAGHVLHALDPELVASGPGKGYGLKKAANGVAAHIELAAKAEGASAGVKTHAGHVATAARSTVSRADEAIAVAQKIQAATDAAAAATLVTQLVSLCEQLTAGADVNADGQIGWGGGEGGLQQAEQHAKLTLAAAKP